MKRFYHEDCLKCVVCKSKLRNGEFYQVAGEPVCENCVAEYAKSMGTPATQKGNPEADNKVHNKAKAFLTLKAATLAKRASDLEERKRLAEARKNAALARATLAQQKATALMAKADLAEYKADEAERPQEV